ncbi:major capsid protein [Azospirillum sp. TSH64]|uniref:major capsid protein n=1 Tax=Azospirillum sp. TSH64 TaxID=652740 RepID=UPI000D60FB41|nr:major capsid protein [Azospirillum sp. TSH64]PWC81258.1 hypothetical protein TSH64_01030 [Azospirillum sp. TSH64]
MDMFDPRVLRGVVENTPTPASFLLNMFFPTVDSSTEETIEFHVVNGRRRISPFVSPLVAGKIVASQGFRVDSFKPAYVKDKRVFDATKGFKRTVGETVGGSLTPAQRIQAHLARETADQIEMLTRRQELMAAEALLDGRVTVEGDGYPTKVVDFGRKAELTKALTGTARWGEAGVSPVKDLQTWAQEIFLASGRAPTDVVMTADAYELLKKDPEYKDAVDTKVANLAAASVTLGPIIIGADGAQMVGTLGKLRLWIYEDYYENEAGEVVPYLPPHTVIMASRGLEGVRHYGAIKDEKAGYQAMPYFLKSWVEEDPAVRWVLMQSAPLVVPYRVNAAARTSVR